MLPNGVVVEIFQEFVMPRDICFNSNSEIGELSSIFALKQLLQAAIIAYYGIWGLVLFSSGSSLSLSLLEYSSMRSASLSRTRYGMWGDGLGLANPHLLLARLSIATI
ncbi:hypothetical protein ACN38_g9450 [Penicillium nordicum]|uniref:Uncharacterized protein n=1 Tax=Penicillium nordicum TaxID=229535 RepID=A0A0N0RY29_9EURO|nr:hypothetical protein ACN38_g9450 [Penicillium nordicum]